MRLPAFSIRSQQVGGRFSFAGGRGRETEAGRLGKRAFLLCSGGMGKVNWPLE